MKLMDQYRDSKESDIILHMLEERISLHHTSLKVITELTSLFEQNKQWLSEDVRESTLKVIDDAEKMNLSNNYSAAIDKVEKQKELISLELGNRNAEILDCLFIWIHGFTAYVFYSLSICPIRTQLRRRSRSDRRPSGAISLCP